MTDQTTTYASFDAAFAHLTDLVAQQLIEQYTSQTNAAFRASGTARLDGVYRAPKGLEGDRARDLVRAVRYFITAIDRNDAPYPDGPEYRADADKIRAEAIRTAKGFVDSAKAKVIRKLGTFKLIEASVSLSGEMDISGELVDGSKVVLYQRQKWVSGRQTRWGWGKSFVQFPALLYVNGKKVSEAEYKAMLAGA